jgi:hypothetical protein
MIARGAFVPAMPELHIRRKESISDAPSSVAKLRITAFAVII